MNIEFTNSKTYTDGVVFFGIMNCIYQLLEIIFKKITGSIVGTYITQ